MISGLTNGVLQLSSSCEAMSQPTCGSSQDVG
jgi:hypothetical protein